MRLAASTTPQLLQVCDVCAGSTTASSDRNHWRLHSDARIEGRYTIRETLSYEEAWSAVGGKTKFYSGLLECRPNCEFAISANHAAFVGFETPDR